MKNYVTQSLIALLLLISVSQVSAQTGDWGALASQVNNEVAVKAGNQKNVFGILTEAGSDQIKVKTADGKSVSEVSFRRENVEKIWLAKLGTGSRKTLQGVAIGAVSGAVVGAGLGLVALLATGGSDNTAGVLIPIAAVGAGIGAAIGGATGFFSGSKNKKNSLIYQK